MVEQSQNRNIQWNPQHYRQQQQQQQRQRKAEEEDVESIFFFSHIMYVYIV